jgi:hypothetical protein
MSLPASPSLAKLPTPDEVRAELRATVCRADELRQLLRLVERRHNHQAAVRRQGGGNG